MCSNIKGEKKKALIAFTILAIVQVALVTGCLVCGIMGKNLDTEPEASDIDYYIGALVVGGVFAVPASLVVLLIIVTSFDKEACASSCIAITMGLINFLGIPVGILGIIFTAAFGLSNCKTEDSMETGFCSYSLDVEENYTIATVSLVFIVLTLLSDFASFFVFCKYLDELMSRNESRDSSARSNQVSQAPSVPALSHRPQPSAPQGPPQMPIQPLAPNPNLSHLQMRQLQLQNQEMQRQIRYLQDQQARMLAPPPYSSGHTPAPYSPGPSYQDPAYPPGRGSTQGIIQPSAPPIPNQGPSGGQHTDDLPPSYESIMQRERNTLK